MSDMRLSPVADADAMPVGGVTWSRGGQMNNFANTAPASFFILSHFVFAQDTHAAWPPQGHFNVLYFASAGSFTGREQEALPAPMPLGKLFAELEARHPGMTAAILDSCLVTVNLDYVDMPADGSDGAVIQEADEVAIIPPVSSG
ncbi:thiS family domain-containing protein [Purpureocillium lavendulum]|uniref:Molybdopterin synthase sulfur carrier subunit n=1 Tax=Purpureocillium lavendulum TaxID=1247861 RepID=A0AB34G4N3_9HYPO|nr:thiS family domain-containing protein [Purpureocillium lavendulum]